MFVRYVQVVTLNELMEYSKIELQTDDAIHTGDKACFLKIIEKKSAHLEHKHRISTRLKLKI